MISLITSDGHRESLEWTAKGRGNPFGLGMVYFRASKRRLFPDEFKDWAINRGAKIVCSEGRERKNVAGALGVVALGLSYDCVVAEKC